VIELTYLTEFLLNLAQDESRSRPRKVGRHRALWAIDQDNHRYTSLDLRPGRSIIVYVPS
jgi:hypothetical protein